MCRPNRRFKISEFKLIMHLNRIICTAINCCQPRKKLFRYKLATLKIQMVLILVEEAAIPANRASFLVAPIRGRIKNFKFWM